MICGGVGMRREKRVSFEFLGRGMGSGVIVYLCVYCKKLCFF